MYVFKINNLAVPEYLLLCRIADLNDSLRTSTCRNAENNRRAEDKKF
jgi:hypothetical protein